MPGITQVDDRGAGSPGQAFAQLVDQRSLETEIAERNVNRREVHPFARYCHQVIATSGVPDSSETRKMASHICGAVAKMPFLPDGEEVVETRGSGAQKKDLTEFDLQVERTAKRAEGTLDSDMVWTSSAIKLARAALEIRKDDPTHAWVNDPLPGDRRSE